MASSDPESRNGITHKRSRTQAEKPDICASDPFGNTIFVIGPGRLRHLAPAAKAQVCVGSWHR